MPLRPGSIQGLLALKQETHSSISNQSDADRSGSLQRGQRYPEQKAKVGTECRTSASVLITVLGILSTMAAFAWRNQ